MSRLSISVIIATYNRAALLGEAVGCLLAQTRVPDEIIIVDDGSTDETPKVLARYSPPVTAVRQSNKGLAAARNTGLRAATGDLIAFLDSDDTLPPDSIERRAAYLEAHPQYDVVYGNVQFVTVGGDPICLYTDLVPGERPSGDVFAQMARHNLMPVHAYMLRRTCLETSGVFDESLDCVEDYDLWIRVAGQHEFAYLDVPLARYHIHDGMMTRLKRRQMLINNLQVRERALALPAFARLEPSVQAELYTKLASSYAVAGDMGKAKDWYSRAIETAPNFESRVLKGLTVLGPGFFRAAAAVKRGLNRSIRSELRGL